MTVSSPLAIAGSALAVTATQYIFHNQSIEVPAALMAGSSPGTISSIAVSSGGIAGTFIEIQVDADFSTAVENGAAAFEFVRGAQRFKLDGPNRAGQTTRDADAPYYWIPVDLAGLVSAIAANRSGWSIVISDESQASTTVVADAGTDKSVASGGTVQLDGSATVQNADGATTWAWTRISGSGGSLDSATAQQPTFTAPTLAAGAANRSIVFELVATNNGVASAGDRVTITVTAPAAEPTTITANAGADKSVASGGSVQLDGSATVQNGVGATTWAWRRVSGSGGVLNETNPQTPTFIAPTLQAGAANLVIVFSLTATNNDVSDTDEVTVTVTAPDAPASTTVVADAGTDKSVASGGTVELDGSATVQNGVGATTWAWTRISGSGGSLDSAAAQQPTFTAPTLAAGAANRLIVFELVATNNGVASAGDRVTITVTAPDAPALAAPVLSGTADDGAVDTSWTAVTGATGYQRRHKRSSSQNWGSWAAAGDDRTQRFGGLVNGVSYDFQVRAIATGQQGQPSNTLTLTPAAAAPPPAQGPTGVEAARLDAGPVVDLFVVRLQGGGVERYTAGPESGSSVTWAGNEYRPVPITLEGAGFGSSGASVRPTLRVSQLDRTAFPADWQGATVERTRTLARYLDGASEADPSRHFETESWVVDRLSSENREEVVWQLSSPLDLELAMIPKRQVLRDVCPWPYRRRVGNGWENPPDDDGCPYRGSAYWNVEDESVADPAQDDCSRRISGCKLRFGANGVLPFGGFAGVSRYRR